MTSAACRVATLTLGSAYLQLATAQTAVLTGTVKVFGDSSRTLQNVSLALGSTGRQLRSDSLGRFRLDGLAAGEYTLYARRLGFEPESVRVHTAATGIVSVELRMRPNVQSLRTMLVRGRRVEYPSRYADAYTRAARMTGQFFSRELIDSLKPYEVKSLLQTVPGVQVSDRGITFQRCQAGLTGARSLTPGDRISLSQTNQRKDQTGQGQRDMSDAHVQVYVDGTRRTLYSSSSTANEDAEHVLRQIDPSSIQLMEVYSGVVRIPGEYLSDACAVILIWTKIY